MTDLQNFCEHYEAILKRNHLEEFASPALAERFRQLTERMLTVNEVMNLTAITEPDDVILKHYADSLTAARFIGQGSTVIDVGCGAGFPSLPLAIARPDLRITALDSTSKRIEYIRETAEILGLSNITCVCARAEDLSKTPEYREKFDVSLARAVARLNVLSELCMPYVRVGGQFLAMKANAAEELSEAGNAFRKLCGQLVRAESFRLVSEEDNPRTIIEVKKISQTPKNYPRNNAQIKKKPL